MRKLVTKAAAVLVAALMAALMAALVAAGMITAGHSWSGVAPPGGGEAGVVAGHMWDD
ncbi:hypothetical protein [Nonomuraea rhizosphaerae]|uniref:hypothetical protein n=1 Tax=Nonomuraea rhizosphaerae TaxID=2665663 RepID=UPI001C601736|nr:hypothetical protein [Nonomuraea rhizosphaerae]